MTKGHKTVAIFGPSGGGKTTFADALAHELGAKRAVVVNVDDYWQYDRPEMKRRGLTGYDWEARDKAKFLQDLDHLQQGKAIDKPLMDYVHEKPANQTERVQPKEVIILEATLDFTDVADLLIFVYAPDEIIVQRRLERDKDVKAIGDIQTLSDYITNISLPAYKANLVPLVPKAHYVVNTYSEKIYKNRLF